MTTGLLYYSSMTLTKKQKSLIRGVAWLGVLFNPVGFAIGYIAADLFTSNSKGGESGETTKSEGA